MKFSIKDFFSKCDQTWSNLLKKSSMENFIFVHCLFHGYGWKTISYEILFSQNASLDHKVEISKEERNRLSKIYVAIALSCLA